MGFQDRPTVSVIVFLDGHSAMFNSEEKRLIAQLRHYEDILAESFLFK